MPDTDQPDAPAGALSYAHLRNRHPCHDEHYWRQLRALMAGGKRLLMDKHAMDALFPPHPNEELAVYEARRARAFHLPYPGEIVGDLVGQLAQDPPKATADPEPDEWYTQTFADDVDRRGLTLLGYAQAMAREALTTCTAWALVELPDPGDAPAELPSLRDQEEAGLLRAYVVPLRAEDVIDWEEDDDGELTWACVHKVSRRRPSPSARRDRVTEVFTFYTATGWTRFVVEYEDGKPPKDSDLVQPQREGDHSFGCVPLVRLELPEGLWAMDKLFGAARAHFQQRSALSYSQNKGLFPLLTAFLGPESGGGGTVPSEAQQNPERATEQVYGVGRVHVFGEKDRLAYTSPDAAVYTFAAADLKDLRDEMHRVCAAMANAMDNSPSSVGRSGESKQQDKSAKELVLLHLGDLLCDHLRDMLALVAKGRGDTGLEWSVAGFRVFDQVSAGEAVETALSVLSLDIPSPTFARVFLTATARRIVAHDATPEQLQDIADEIEDNVSDEEFAALPPRAPPIPPGGGVVDPNDPAAQGVPPAPGNPPPKAPPGTPAKAPSAPRSARKVKRTP